MVDRRCYRVVLAAVAAAVGLCATPAFGALSQYPVFICQSSAIAGGTAFWQDAFSNVNNAAYETGNGNGPFVAAQTSCSSSPTDNISSDVQHGLMAAIRSRFTGTLPAYDASNPSGAGEAGWWIVAPAGATIASMSYAASEYFDGTYDDGAGATRGCVDNAGQLIPAPQRLLLTCDGRLSWRIEDSSASFAGPPPSPDPSDPSSGWYSALGADNGCPRNASVNPPSAYTQNAPPAQSGPCSSQVGNASGSPPSAQYLHFYVLCRDDYSSNPHPCDNPDPPGWGPQSDGSAPAPPPYIMAVTLHYATVDILPGAPPTTPSIGALTVSYTNTAGQNVTQSANPSFAFFNDRSPDFVFQLDGSSSDAVGVCSASDTANPGGLHGSPNTSSVSAGVSDYTQLVPCPTSFAWGRGTPAGPLRFALPVAGGTYPVAVSAFDPGLNVSTTNLAVQIEVNPQPCANQQVQTAAITTSEPLGGSVQEGSDHWLRGRVAVSAAACDAAAGIASTAVAYETSPDGSTWSAPVADAALSCTGGSSAPAGQTSIASCTFDSTLGAAGASVDGTHVRFLPAYCIATVPILCQPDIPYGPPTLDTYRIDNRSPEVGPVRLGVPLSEHGWTNQAGVVANWPAIGDGGGSGVQDVQAWDVSHCSDLGSGAPANSDSPAGPLPQSTQSNGGPPPVGQAGVGLEQEAASLGAGARQFTATNRPGGGCDEGLHVIAVRARDVVDEEKGTWGAWSLHLLMFDSVAPTLNPQQPVQNGGPAQNSYTETYTSAGYGCAGTGCPPFAADVAPTDALIAATASPYLGGSYTVDGSSSPHSLPAASGSFDFELGVAPGSPYPASGDHTLNMTVIDEAGNRSTNTQPLVVPYTSPNCQPPA